MMSTRLLARPRQLAMLDSPGTRSYHLLTRGTAMASFMDRAGQIGRGAWHDEREARKNLDEFSASGARRSYCSSLPL